jgi:hypothetical protein
MVPKFFYTFASSSRTLLFQLLLSKQPKWGKRTCQP